VPAVALSYLLQRGVGVLPRSSSAEHILENARLLSAGGSSDRLGVILSRRELLTIDALDGGLDTHPGCAAWAQAGA
jgi:diketogulonate reductase-like aldo/keto reductase